MRSKEWTNFTLRDISKSIAYGYTTSAQFEPIGPKFLRITDIVGGLNWDTVPYCEIAPNDYKKYKLDIGDIVIARTGATTGTTEIIKEDKQAVFASYLIRFRIDEAIADPFFIGHVLKSDSWKEFIKSSIGGSAQPGANATVLSQYEILLPPLPTQRRIADILSALDDKIELNRQTNATFEAIAQAIFKEWFVNFNFPGATGEMVESEMGMIPKGWRVGSVGDILVLANETTSPGVDPDKLFNHYSIPAFDSGRVPSQELGSTILSNKYKVKCNSILVSKLNPRIPRIWALKEVDQESSVCSTEFQVLLPQKAHYYSFAANLFSQQSVIDIMKSRASGTSSSHQRINPLDILDINTVVPTNDLIALYDKIVGNYFHCIINGLEKSINLAKIRDSLLPKLMNGEIEV